jgi:alanine racemase
LRVVSKLARIAPIRGGEGVSYGLTYRAKRDEWVGLVPIGYADGYPRGLSNVGWMEVKGKRLPIRGRICMDQTVVGVDDTALIEIGDVVAVLGGDGPSIDEVATATGTIAYEIATGLARRMPRQYVRTATPAVD